MIDALAEVTGADKGLCKIKLKRIANGLLDSTPPYTPADVRDWRKCEWEAVWPGNKGEWPKPEDVRDRIGRIRAGAMQLPLVSDGDQNRYLADPYFQNKDEMPTAPARRPALTTGHDADRWLMLIGQLSIQVNHLSVATYILPMRLVQVDHDADGSKTFIVEGLRQGGKEWFDRHLKAKAERDLGDFYPTPCVCHIQIEVED